VGARRKADIAAITWLCVFVPVFALVVVHIVFARQLLQEPAEPAK
jgi:hypothetical protein